MSLSPTSLDPYVQVGRSGLVVYRVGLGTMQFGWSADEAAAFDVMDTYVDAGGNFIDTADCYSSWGSRMGGPVNPGGISEEIVGRWLAARGNRDDIVLATKVRAAMGSEFSDNRATIKQREGLSRRWITRACEDSLRRLQVDHIDLYQAHFIDPLVPIEETLGAFTNLVRRGLVRYIGVSNFSAWRLMQALWTIDTHDFEPIVSIQPEYNMLPRVRANFERELASVCQTYGIGVIPYSPLAGGLLTGKYRPGQANPDSVRAAENVDRIDDSFGGVIETLLNVAERTGLTPAQTAIAWNRAQTVVSAPIVGANRPDQLQQVLDGLDTELSPDDLALLNNATDWPRSRTDREE